MALIEIKCIGIFVLPRLGYSLLTDVPAWLRVRLLEDDRLLETECLDDL